MEHLPVLSADASYSLTITGGISPYQDNINSAGNETVSGDGIFNSTSFESGTFSYVITDANGCVWNGYPSVVVVPKNEIEIKSETGGSPVTNYDIECPGAEISLIYKGEGGTGTFMPAKLINNRTMVERTANSIAGVFTFNNVIEDNTTYDLIIKDSDGCEKTLAGIMVTDPDDLLGVEGVKSSPTCFAGDNGSFTVTAMGGTPGEVPGGTPGEVGYKFVISKADAVKSLSSTNDNDFVGPLNNEFGITDPDPDVFRSDLPENIPSPLQMPGVALLKRQLPLEIQLSSWSTCLH